MRIPALVLSLAALVVTTAAPADPVGLWGAEARLGPRVRGTLLLEQDGTRWTMRVGGFEASSAIEGANLRIDLPSSLGTLRARVEGDGAAVRAFWIQPAGNLVPYATPVALTRAGDTSWRGAVVPLDETLSLYLAIDREPGGTLRGSFHNPERNWTGGAPWFRISVAGDRLRFVDPRTGRERLAQPYDPAGPTISMDFGAPVALTPRSIDEAVGYVPWSPGALPYKYRMPVPSQDGWRVARAASVGIDEARLESLVQRLAAADPAGGRRVQSVLVARRGQLVLDEYFYGFGPDRLHDLRSASKTFTSVMAGIAMDGGATFSVDTPIASLLPSAPGADADPRRARITVGHLLTHSSGLACDDNDDGSPGHEDTMQQASADWYAYTLALPIAHEPGTKYSYCSGGVNLVGGAIARAAGAWLPDYFDRHVARPLGIDRYAINLMPSGEAYAAGGIHMRPRDLLKFGQLYLNGGAWRDRRIVSERWVRESTARQIDVPGGSSDGYGWHRYTLRVGDRELDEYEASGNGGQFLVVVPALDLVVVFTGGNYGQYPIWRTYRDSLLTEHLLPAVAAVR